jgi:hypothetical protein
MSVIGQPFRQSELPLLLAGQRPTAGRHEPGIWPTDVSLRGPTYHENSHAHLTWDLPSRLTACFPALEALPAWVRFPSPAPFFWLTLAYVVLGRARAKLSVPTVSSRHDRPLNGLKLVPEICQSRPAAYNLLQGQALGFEINGFSVRQATERDLERIRAIGSSGSVDDYRPTAADSRPEGSVVGGTNAPDGVLRSVTM